MTSAGTGRKIPPWLVFFSLGFTAQLAQLVMMRELLVTFQGSEIAFAVMLGTWLFWTASGSFLAHKFTGPAVEKACLGFIAATILICIVMPLEVLGIRMLRPLCGVISGQYIPLSKLIASTLVLFAPIGLCLGAQFTMAARGVRSAAGVYVSESLGSAVAGFLLSLLLVPALDSFSLIFLTAFVHLAAAFMVLRIGCQHRENKSAAGSAPGPAPAPLRVGGLRIILAALCVLAAGLFVGGKHIDVASRTAFWHGFNPSFKMVATEESPYGNLAVLTYNSQYSVYQSGKLVFCLPDRGEAAPYTHVCMVQHPKPRKVLLIGGGVAGMLKNVLLHDVTRVDYVEIDPRLVGISKQHAGPDDVKALDDARVAFSVSDGRAFLRRSPGGYDMIIVNVGDPDTAQINRFYTEEFFREVKARLGQGGVLCLGPFTTTANCQVGPALTRNASVYWTLKQVFANVLGTPGTTLSLMASDAAGSPTLDARDVLGRLSARKIENVNIFGFLDEFGVTQVNHELRTGQRYNPLDALSGSVKEKMEPSNTDNRPFVYYLSMLMWSKVVGDNFMSLLMEPFQTVSNLYLILAAVFILAAVLFGIAWRWTGAATLPAVSLGTQVSGLSGMVVGIMIIFAFQNALGSVYQSVGIIMALFMTGLALGSEWARRKVAGGNSWRTLIYVQLLFAVFLLVLPWLLKAPLLFGAPILQMLVFGLLNLAGGVFTGVFYPVAVAAGAAARNGKDCAGVLYASDLAGGCVGALLISVFILPLFGYQAIALGCAGLNLIGALVMRAARPGK